MDLTELFAFTAQTKGASGVHAFLRERRQQVRDVLVALGQPVLLEDAQPGARIEQLSRGAQREIWSALVSAGRNEDAVQLARDYLRVAGQPRRIDSDGVCLSLARMVIGAGQEENEAVDAADAAFRRRMQRVILDRVVFPSSSDELTVNEGGSMATTMSTHLHKRSKPVVYRQYRPTMIAKLGDSSGDESLDESAGAEMQEQPPLTQETENRASELSKQLVQLARAEASAATNDIAARAYDMLAEVVSDVHTTYAANERSFRCLCQMLRLHLTSDEALLQITSSLVDANWSSRYATIFLETSVLPKIQAADSVISRNLLQIALRFGSGYTGILLDSLLLPLLVGSASDIVGPAQAEAITRILRSPGTVKADQLDDFIQRSLDSAVVSSRHLLSNDSALLVFQNILNPKPVISAVTVGKLVAACEAALERPEGEQLRGSLKFATLLFTLISKYPKQCDAHVDTLEAIATGLTSTMAKAVMRSLQKLKTSK